MNADIDIVVLYIIKGNLKILRYIFFGALNFIWIIENTPIKFSKSFFSKCNFLKKCRDRNTYKKEKQNQIYEETETDNETKS